MADSVLERYTWAFVASGISLLGWFGVILGPLAVGYFWLTEGPVAMAGWATLASLVIGIIFARIEHRLMDA